MPVILDTWETEIAKIAVWGQPKQKFRDPFSTKKAGMVGHTWGPSFKWAIDRRIAVPGQPRQKHKIPSEKYPTAKRAGGLPQVVEHLASKHRVLSSNPSTTPPPKKSQWPQLTPHKDLQRANNHMKRYPKSSVIRKMQIKTKMKYHYTPVSWQNSENWH
jgi:hypothetical protein